MDQKENGVQRRLRGFELEEKGVPRQGYDLVDEHGTKIGRVTSGTMSPSLKKGIGMGYVDASHSAFGNRIFVQIRNKAVPARVVKLPFYKPA